MTIHEENSAPTIMNLAEFENRLYEARQELARLKAAADSQRLWLVACELAAGHAFVNTAVETFEVQQTQGAKRN